MANLLICILLVVCQVSGQGYDDYGSYDDDRYIASTADRSISDMVRSFPYLSEFAKMLLESEGLHSVYLDRQITLFAPTNEAMKEFYFKRNSLGDRTYHKEEVDHENLVLNHMTNVAVFSRYLQDQKLASLVTGGPPLWVSRHRLNRLAYSPLDGSGSSFDNGTGIFVNQAEIVAPDIPGRSARGDEQVLHVIDSVLEPLIPITLRQSEFFVNLDAQKLLAKSTLYNLDGNHMRVFQGAADLNRRTQMFSVKGAHTFFMPVDTAFDVSVHVSGQDNDNLYNRGISRNVGSSIQTYQSKQRVRKELVDARVIEGHIVPHKLLFTSQAPTIEYPTVAWVSKEGGIKVNVSLQVQTSSSTSSDRRPDVEQSFVYNAYQQEDHLPANSDEIRRLENKDKQIVVRSNTVVGDRAHAKGMVVARIVKGNIPVENGVVHLIDKPLMIVDGSMFEYLMEQGRERGNRISDFARLVRDKGGKFADALLEAKDGTLLVPSNEAMERVDQQRLDYILGDSYLRTEMFGLHLTRERITSTQYKITASNDATYSSPASYAANRVWFHNNQDYSRGRAGATNTMSVWGRGVNASASETDIGTVNGVIHVIDRVLGVPHQTIAQYIESDPNLSHMWSLMKQLRIDRKLSNPQSRRMFTVIVPSNAAWEKAQLNFGKAFNTLQNPQFPQYAFNIMMRHVRQEDGSRPKTFEQLVELTRKNPRRQVPMANGGLKFTQLGDFSLDAYKDNFVSMSDEVRGKVVRPNAECTNGYVHVVDTVMIDDSPVWAVAQSSATPSLVVSNNFTLLTIASTLALVLSTKFFSATHFVRG